MRCTSPYMGNGGAFPCGQCLPCRINLRRMWMHRMMLEATQHEHSSFITLTYADPAPRDLVPKDLQDWLKRFRKSLSPLGVRVRFYAAGEYGETSWRPHYHIAMFGYPGCVYGQSRYSKSIKRCCANCDRVLDTWSRGLVYVGALGPESMQYVAGYVMKKMTAADDQRLDMRVPEFSRKSIGLGRDALHNVAETIKRLDLDIAMPDVPVGLRHGHKVLPLGRYLRRRLRVLLGRSPDAPDIALQEIREEMQRLRTISWDSQETGKFIPVSEVFEKENRQRLNNVENRQRIFKQRKSL